MKHKLILYFHLNNIEVDVKSEFFQRTYEYIISNYIRTSTKDYIIQSNYQQSTLSNIIKMSSDHSQSSSDSEIQQDLKELLLDDSYYCPDESYEIQIDKQVKESDNPYIMSLYETAKLKILQRELVENEWNKRHEIGLFYL